MQSHWSVNHHLHGDGETSRGQYKKAKSKEQREHSREENLKSVCKGDPVKEIEDLLTDQIAEQISSFTC